MKWPHTNSTESWSAVIDLDPILRPWVDEPPPWDEDQTVHAVQAAADKHGLPVAEFEPPDEEWIRFGDANRHGMMSVRYPLAFANDGIAFPKGITVVRYTHSDDENIRASRELLQATLLPHGISDDFDTEAFSAGDLFVESV